MSLCKVITTKNACSSPWGTQKTQSQWFKYHHLKTPPAAVSHLSAVSPWALFLPSSWTSGFNHNFDALMVQPCIHAFIPWVKATDNLAFGRSRYAHLCRIEWLIDDVKDARRQQSTLTLPPLNPSEVSSAVSRWWCARLVKQPDNVTTWCWALPFRIAGKYVASPKRLASVFPKSASALTAPVIVCSFNWLQKMDKNDNTVLLSQIFLHIGWANTSCDHAQILSLPTKHAFLSIQVHFQMLRVSSTTINLHNDMRVLHKCDSNLQGTVYASKNEYMPLLRNKIAGVYHCHG